MVKKHSLVLVGVSGALVVTLAVMAAVLGFWVARATHADSMSEAVALKTYYFTGVTDENGAFSITHGINTDVETIVGINVAVKSNVNPGWYSLLSQADQKSRFSWTDTTVGGVIEDRKDFAESAVKVIVFTKTQ